MFFLAWGNTLHHPPEGVGGNGGGRGYGQGWGTGKFFSSSGSSLFFQAASDPAPVFFPSGSGSGFNHKTLYFT